MGRPEAALRLLGLATRAGTVLTGTERVRDAVRGGQIHYVIVAADASDNSRAKLLPLLGHRGTAHSVAYDRDSLGAAVGRGPLSAVGVTDPALAGRLRELLAGT